MVLWVSRLSGCACTCAHFSRPCEGCSFYRLQRCHGGGDGGGGSVGGLSGGGGGQCGPRAASVVTGGSPEKRRARVPRRTAIVSVQAARGDGRKRRWRGVASDQLPPRRGPYRDKCTCEQARGAPPFHAPSRVGSGSVNRTRRSSGRCMVPGGSRGTPGLSCSGPGTSFPRCAVPSGSVSLSPPPSAPSSHPVQPRVTRIGSVAISPDPGPGTVMTRLG